MIESIKNADMLIYGIGEAETMCLKRGMNEEKIHEIMAKGAVGEAFGCYFSKDGEVVYSISSIGVTKEDSKNIKELIAVAGGSKKANAIIAAELDNSSGVLITDEGAARKILDSFK